MGEMSKQVRVDNWGTFFLQRLQAFFNKTEYCDLTLQFEGNVQLKVHRLVLYACTEYFHVLEHTCTMTDDVLIMPPDLQADVIVPIINFMYTGMLEFQLSMFDKLYQAATLMNITILTKLLDAQRKPYFLKSAHAPKKPERTPEKRSPVHKAGNSHLPATLPGRKIPVWKRKVAPSHQHAPEPTINPLILKPRVAPSSDPLAIYDNAPKPTRFEWPDEEEDDLAAAFNPLDSTFDDISYTSRPLLTQEDELKACSEAKRAALRAGKGQGDGEEFGREQKMRFAFDDDESMDADVLPVESSPSSSTATKRKATPASPTTSTTTLSKRVRFNLGEKENKEKKFSITTSGKAADMDHTKIISELLKKYPDLVKKNKNIRLKIMAKGEKNPAKATSKVRVQVNARQAAQKMAKVVQEALKKDEGPWACNLCSSTDEKVEFVLYYLYRKHMTDVHNEKFDSRMCKFCGHKSQKHNMLMYHMYTKHGVKPPAAYNFPKCNQCNYIALTEALLFKHQLNHTRYELQCRECKIAFTSMDALENHMQVSGHTTKSGKANFSCQYCGKQYQSGVNLFSHIRMLHREDAKRDGIVNIDEIGEGAAHDDADDEDTTDTKQQIREEDEYITPEIINETKSKEKFKILQNVKVPVVPQQHQQEQSSTSMTLEPSSEAEALSNVASGIATSLGLVDIVVLNDNQQYILQSNEQLPNTQPEFILPELNSSQFAQNQTIAANQGEINPEHNVIAQSMLNSGDIASTDELVMVLTDHDYGDGNNELIANDNSNIVVLYSHPVDGQENQFITSQGNLMVNSQTGMIEIRNSGINTTATTTSNTIVVTQAQDTPIESIEMIQQEINSQMHQEEQQTAHAQPESDVAHAQQEFGGEEEEGEVVQQPEVEGEGETQKSEEETKESGEVQQEEVTEPPKLEGVEAQQESVEEATNVVAEAAQQQDLEGEENNTAPELTAEPETTAEEEATPTKNLEMPVLEEEEEQQQPQQLEEEEQLETPPAVENNDGNKTDEEEQPLEKTAEVAPSEEDQGESSSQEGAPPAAGAKCSILDDWEDTDSQQSEHSRGGKPPVNTVNKLMDDWADEEEDESKKAAAN